jgi:Zn-dependent protease with chaperone function
MQATELGSYLPSTLALREQWHRRVTIGAVAALLLLSTGPVFGHHLPVWGAALLDGVDHIGALCLTALHQLLAPVHTVFHVVIIAGLLYAAADRLRAWWRVRRTLDVVETRPPRLDDRFWRAAREAALAPRRLRIVPGLPSPAFTAGLFSPCVYVAEELAGRLSEAELAAVLAHEAAHVRRRDPLRLSLLRALACTLFWIPALRRLADDIGDEAEVLADDAAAGEKPLVLASAILALAQWPQGAMRESWPSESAVGLQRRDLLERRIRRLVGEETPVQSHVTGRSMAGAMLALLTVWSSGLLMTHPLPAHAAADAPARARHCEHRHASALSHLFCRDSAVTSVGVECPHGV